MPTESPPRPAAPLGASEASAASPSPVAPARSAALPTTRHERAVHGVAVGAIVVSFIAFALRAQYAYNPAAPLLSIGFCICELLFVASGVIALLALAAGRSALEEPPPAPPGLSVDVLIATLDEDVDLVRRTARRALAIRYPHRTFILDDGNRPAMRALADELGCGYIARPDAPRAAKAGNLNYGIAHTSGEFLLFFDADALAHPAILDRTLGFFGDARVALVQTPQVFYNVDAIDQDYSPRRRALWSASALFHHNLQRGFARLGAALCVGSAFVARRSALAAVGGVPEVVSEDVRTTRRLHAAGFESRYVEETLAFHLDTDGLGAYWTQRMRWTRGALRALFDLPSLKGRLRAGQWVVYVKYGVEPLLDLARFAIRFVPVLCATAGVQAYGPGFALDRVTQVAWGIGFLSSLFAPLAIAPFRYRIVLGRAFGHLRSGVSIVSCLRELVGQPFAWVNTPKKDGAPAPAVAYATSVLAVAAGLVGTAYSLRPFAGAIVHGRRMPIGSLPIAFFCVDLLVSGILALWLVRGRRTSLEPGTVPVLRRGRFAPEGGGAEVALEVVRLGPGEAVAVGPAGLAPARGTLAVALEGAEETVAATLAPAPDRLEPRPPAGSACYRLALAPDAAARDRLADAIDAVEVPRFFASLREAPCSLPPEMPAPAAEPIPFYRERPVFPPVRF